MLVSTKGVVWTSNAADIYTPTNVGPDCVTFLSPTAPAVPPRWTGTIDATGLAARPINSDVRGVDAGDIVTFVITIQNTGSSLNGAFDIELRDVIPPQYTIPAGGINFQAYYGDGSQGIPYHGITSGCDVNPYADNDSCGEDLFLGGIELIDPAGIGVCQAHDPNNTNDVIVITYDLELRENVGPGDIINTSHLMNYAGSEGGPNHLAEDQENTATTTVLTSLNKALVSTEIVNGTNANNEAVIGEFVTYRMVATIPEGEIPNLQLVDTLDGGLAFVDVTSFTVSDLDLDLGLPFDSGIYYTGSPLPITPTIGVGGQSITFDFGNTTNTDRVNIVAETITIEYRAVVLNIAGNQGAGSPGAATLLNNRARSVWTGGNTTFVSAANVTVIESAVTTTKTAMPLTADAGDPITFTITLENTGETDAWDLTWTDTVPAGLNYQGGTLAFIPGCPATTTSVVDSLATILSASLSDLGFGDSCQVTFNVIVDNSVAPLQVITNTARTRWTSMNGIVTDRSTYIPSSDEERTGEGGVDDYLSSGSADVTVNNTGIIKRITATSDISTTGDVVIVGEEVTYSLLISFPEAITPSDVVVDDLPSGLEVVSGSPEVITSASASGGLLTADFDVNGSLGTQNISIVSGDGGSVTFEFGVLATNIVLPGDNNPANNSIVLRFRARVTNAATTIIDGRITNEATNQVGAAAPVTSNQVNVWLRTMTKSVTSSYLPTLPLHSAPSTTLPDVTIGEVVIYQLELTLPPNSSDTATIIDTMDTGLAFRSCLEISRSDTTITSSTVSFSGPGNCSGAPVLGVSSTNASPENQGNVVAFNLGTIINTSGTPQTIIIAYEVIVLNIASNVQTTPRVTLDNGVVWTGSHGSLSTQAAPATRIVEPTMSIVKTISPEAAIRGSTVTYSIQIEHTFDSLTTAYDVIVTDGIPTGLVLNQASVTVTGSAGLPAPIITTSPTQFSVYWSQFNLGESALITFQAVYVGPDTVINTANVEWSTLQIDPAPRFTPQSSFNPASTERRYDPLSPAGVNSYIARSSVSLAAPGRLPRTGFAPGHVTHVPPQPTNYAYSAQSDLWIEIPRLGIQLDIVGIPFNESNEWDLTWLGDQAGWLEGSAFPTLAGNSALTAHTYLPDGLPGPFVSLGTLRYGDSIIVHYAGQKYTYAVRENRVVRPDSVGYAFQHEEFPWLTLVTCRTFSETSDDYVYRVVVRAVQVSVETE